MNSLQLKQEDAHLVDSLENVVYFNLEVSPCMGSLVFNASKNGINAFLKVYGDMEIPPQTISFKELQRPNRRWLSPEIQIDEHIKASDPTPYKLNLNGSIWNHLIPELRMELSVQDKSTILYAEMRDNVPWDGIPF